MVTLAGKTVSACPFIPSRDNVVVQELEDNNVIGNIALPDDCSDMPKRGRVVAVGPGLWNNGQYEPTGYEVGDELLMFADQPFTRIPIYDNGERLEYFLVRAVYLRGKLRKE